MVFVIMVSSLDYNSEIRPAMLRGLSILCLFSEKVTTMFSGILDYETVTTMLSGISRLRLSLLLGNVGVGHK